MNNLQKYLITSVDKHATLTGTGSIHDHNNLNQRKGHLVNFSLFK